MESKIRQSIIKTVLYADIFDYPLTSAQIWKYLITSKQIKRKDFDRVLGEIKNLPVGRQSPIRELGGWYFLSNRENLVRKRLRRKKESSRKLSLAVDVAGILSRIPTVLLIGVSGGAAMHNADKNDDIDIFIITKKNTIWQTRFLSVLLLTFLGKYRKRTDRKVTDKICLNMLIDEQGLAFPENRQDLYTAHEILQMKPIFSRNKTYEKFLAVNHWIEDFLPNSVNVDDKKIRIKNRKQTLIVRYSLFIIEFLVKEIQLWYIKRHISRETIGNEMLAFHPLDYKEKIMKAYGERLRKYGQKI